MKLFDPKRNDLTIDQVSKLTGGSQKKLTWIHESDNGKFHNWTTTISSVVRGTRCPECCHDKNQYNSYDYTSKNGIVFVCIQGYEKYFIELGFLPDHELIHKRSQVPKIEYIFNGKKRRYYVDFYHHPTNTCIEVKSPWTMTRDVPKIIAKLDACLKLGFHYLIFVFNENGKLCPTPNLRATD